MFSARITRSVASKVAHQRACASTSKGSEGNGHVDLKKESVKDLSVSQDNKVKGKTKRPHAQLSYEDEDLHGQSAIEPSMSTSTESPYFAKKRPKMKWEPAHWKELLDNITKMRSQRDAPVDTMGCDRLGDRSASPQTYRYQIMLSLMLSSQTKDQVTAAAMYRLREHGCDMDNILKTSGKKLGELICPVGFWRRKVEYIKKTTKILIDDFEGDIPDSVESLCELPGIGPKMAHLIMKSAWQKISGIGVDVHVHRISNRLKWVRKPTSQPEQTRKELEDWLPKEHWSTINELLVGFGQQTCLPLRPKCSDCLNRDICPSAEKKTIKKELKISPAKQKAGTGDGKNT